MKALILEWHKFTWLQRLLAIIDIILNPRASDWPFLYCDAPSIMGFDEDLMRHHPRHIVVKQFEEGGRYYAWCIRWL